MNKCTFISYNNQLGGPALGTETKQIIAYMDRNEGLDEFVTRVMEANELDSLEWPRADMEFEHDYNEF